MILAAIALTAAVPSFDCTKAATPVETLICGDEVLAHADKAVAQAYRAAKARKAKRVVADQRRWLAERDGCRNRDCLVSHYEERLFDLMSVSHLGRDYDMENGNLTVLSLGGDWYAFSVLRTYIRPSLTLPSNVTTDAWASGVFRLVDSKGERLDDISGWRLTRLRDGWRVECLPDSMSCGGANATIDGDYR